MTARRGAGLAGLALAGAGAAAAAAGAGLPALGAAGAGLALSQLLLLDLSPVRVPVVMLHSIAGHRPDRPPAFSIWCPPPMFEGYLRFLRRRGYRTVTLADLHEHLARGRALPPRPIVLTFDDGYLDNWVHAAPLLRRHGFTATVFVASDFVQPGESVRPTLEDVWAGRLREHELEVFGYMNRAELRALACEGTFDVQSHGRTHTWLPVADEVIDFHNPRLPMRHLRWMWWNRHPERKPYWFHEIDPEGVPWGAPVHRNALALSRPAVEPDPGLERLCVTHVAENGGRAFFERPDWRAELSALAAEHQRRHGQRPPEPRAAFLARLRGELEGSRAALEEITGQPVRFMCWPNGGTCEEAFDLLAECGYLAATLPSRARQPINRRGTNPARFGRISATSFFRGSPRVFPWVFSFAVKVERNRGNMYMELPIKAVWLYRRFVRPSGEVPAGAEP
ncbi:MAG: polysaccharide deacetylase family protein [Acidobacteria bacterium]|nr:polysaccharide deacetylase family protein [Acidobacteriota bacterium]